MAFDEPNYENLDEAPLPEESGNNRTFLIAVGILGGIILISLACLVGVYLFGSQSRTAAQQQAAANATLTAQAADNFISQALTSTFEASILPTATLEPTNTAVVSVATATETSDGVLAQQVDTAATATVGAALTQAAAAQLTIVPPTQLARTGFLDDYGIPGLAVMTITFVIVILLARRLRTTPTR
jgi:type II secretory pathway pseudopilin PulG